MTDTVIMGPPFLFTYPTHVSLTYTSWRVLSHYFQTLRGFSFISSHHAGSVSSRRGDQTPCCIIPTCVVLCYVTCNRTELSSYVPLVWDIAYSFISTSNRGHFKVTYYPLARMCDINCLTSFAQVGHSRATEL